MTGITPAEDEAQIEQQDLIQSKQRSLDIDGQLPATSDSTLGPKARKYCRRDDKKGHWLDIACSGSPMAFRC